MYLYDKESAENRHIERIALEKYRCFLIVRLIRKSTAVPF